VELRQLVYFLHVVELGSFTRAQHQLSIAQPALSRQIRALEEELKQKLFERNGRGVVPTEAGRQLVSYAQEIVRLMESARQDVSGGNDVLSGECRIALPPSVGSLLTLPIVHEFSEYIPRAHLAVFELPSTSILEWVSQGRVDFGLAQNAPESVSYKLTVLASEKLHLIGPAGDADVRQPISVSEIANYPLIVPSARQGRLHLVEAEMASANATMNVTWEVGSTTAILDLVRAGLGYAILSLNALHGRREQFVARPIVDPEITITLSLAVPTRRPLSRLAVRVCEIIETLLPQLAET
jgi:LysR family nitrogen assimilation transcriptional regulator